MCVIVYIYIYMHACMYMYVYIYIYIYVCVCAFRSLVLVSCLGLLSWSLVLLQKSHVSWIWRQHETLIHLWHSVPFCTSGRSEIEMDLASCDPTSDVHLVLQISINCGLFSLANASLTCRHVYCATPAFLQSFKVRCASINLLVLRSIVVLPGQEPQCFLAFHANVNSSFKRSHHSPKSLSFNKGNLTET